MDAGLFDYHLANPATPLAVGYLLEVVGHPPSLESLRTFVGHRVSLSPTLAASIVWAPGRRAGNGEGGKHLRWAVDPCFRPADHVYELRLPARSGQSGLHDAADRLATHDIPLSRPPWQVWLISGYRSDAFAVLFRASHIQLDGTALNSVLSRLFGTTQFTSPNCSRTSTAGTAPVAGNTSVAGNASATAAARRSRGARPGIRAVCRAALSGRGWASRTARVPALAVPATGQPRHTWATVELDRLRTIARAQGASVNDVFLAALAGALHAWSPAPSEDRPGGRRARRSSRVHVSVPVSTRRAAEAELLSNYVAGIRVALPWQDSSASCRLQAVRRQTARHKRDGNAGAAERLFFEATPARLRPAALSVGFCSASVALSASNIGSLPGTLEVLGRSVVAARPVAPLFVGQRLAVLLGGWGDTVCVGFTADTSVPDSPDLGALFVDAVDELAVAVGLTQGTDVVGGRARGAGSGTRSRIPRPRHQGSTAAVGSVRTEAAERTSHEA